MVKKTIKNRGFSLVEIMIAIALGLILTGFILSIFVNNKKSYNTNNRVIELNSNIRFALSMIQADLDNAGFYGGLNSRDTITPNINNNNACTSSTGIQLSSATNFPIWGQQASSDPEVGCLAGITAGTDFISIRGVRGNMTADGSLDANRVYVRAGKTVGEFIGSGIGSSIPNSDNMNWKYYSSIYYICQNRLLRQSLEYNAGSSQWNTEVLIGPELAVAGTCSNADAHTEAGIENIQLLYGVDNDQDGVADFYTDGSNLTTLAAWNQVIEVKISLLARSEEDKNYQDKNSSGNQKTYSLSGQSYTPASSASHYHRSLMTKTIFIHNNWYGIVNDPGSI
jgi:type IV pilus assembly protein PilW